MILIEAGERSEKGFDAKIVFANQLAQRGHKVVIDDRSLPERIDRNQQFEVAPFLADLSAVEISRVLVIGAENLSGETALDMRHARFGPATKVTAIGRFADRQSAIAAQSKIAYATGREPDLVDLTVLQGAALLVNAISPLAAAPVVNASDGLVPNVFVFLPQEALDDPQTLPILSAMDQLPSHRLHVILPGKGKEQVRNSRHSALRVHGYSELSPDSFAGQTDIAVFFGDGVPGERMGAYALNLMRSGKVVIDCTSGAGFLAAGAPVLRGPEDLTALAAFVQHMVLVNRNEIGRQAMMSAWLTRHGIEALEAALGLPAQPVAPDASSHRTMFLPTNGVGLGHAQRCSLIASKMARPDDSVFAAFPSCIGLIRDKGFDCLPLVQKSPDHPQDHANDILTYLRLSRSLSYGDRLVFDGGYIFDSIYRVVQELRLDAVWIRRGLWQAGQSLHTPSERERIFDRVIVPAEAFEELNAEYGFSTRIHPVGPVVQDLPAPTSAARTAQRDALAAKLGQPFEKLVVTMLGGGVAADRTAQLQALATMMTARPDCLHLVVVWPGSVVPPGLHGLPNTRVVQTRNALALCQVAEFVISAAGYNSYHELLYHGIPTIFVPQMASYMDDQERRARAAADRGLAEIILAHEVLLLDRAVTAFLDGGRAAEISAALTTANLPERGNARAASVIELRGGVA
ncbi:MAG: glycosyltransferase [Albidovulum sp.]